MPKRWPRPRKSARRSCKARTSRIWRAPNRMTPGSSCQRRRSRFPQTRPDRALVRGGGLRAARRRTQPAGQDVPTAITSSRWKRRKPTRTFEELRPELERNAGKRSQPQVRGGSQGQNQNRDRPRVHRDAKGPQSGPSSDPNPQAGDRLSAVRLRRMCSTVARPTAATTTCAPIAEPPSNLPPRSKAAPSPASSRPTRCPMPPTPPPNAPSAPRMPST